MFLDIKWFWLTSKNIGVNLLEQQHLSISLSGPFAAVLAGLRRCSCFVNQNHFIFKNIFLSRLLTITILYLSMPSQRRAL